MFHKLFASIMNLWINDLISDAECVRLIVALDEDYSKVGDKDA